MAPKTIAYEYDEVAELKQALQTAKLELQFERSSRAVEEVKKDEESRKLRYHILLLEEENDQLQEHLVREEERADALQGQLDDVYGRSDELQADLQQANNDLRMQARDLNTMKAELISLQNISNDSTKLLTEKLALARELATLKPEVEHLRSQSTASQGLLAEKLALERQLNIMQVELENEKRANQRASAKENKTRENDARLEAQIEELSRELYKEKQQREAERKTHQKKVDEMEKQARTIQDKLTAADKTKSRESDLKSEVEEIRAELIKEKRERQKAEASLQRSEADWETQRSVLDEKLNNFRTKLRSTKERLKEYEAELQQAKAAAAASRPAVREPAAVAAAKTKKRTAVQMDPDAAIGTPGDGLQAKRTKRLSTVPGDKSTFSITPFLNRTLIMEPDTALPEAEEDAEVEEAAQAEDDYVEEAEQSPIAAKPAARKRAAAKAKAKVLEPASDSATNVAKPRQRKRAAAAAPALSQVREESADAEHNQEGQNHEAPGSKPTDQPSKPANSTVALKPKPRKSLATFATFAEESLMHVEKKKKRKLPGTANSSLLGKTLFDDDDEDPNTSLTRTNMSFVGGRSLLVGNGQRSFGAATARALAGANGGLLGAKGKFKGGLITAEDGFQFSPLKKDRKAAVLAGGA